MLESAGTKTHKDTELHYGHAKKVKLSINKTEWKHLGKVNIEKQIILC